MNILKHVHMNYFQSMFDTNRKAPFLSKPEKVKLQISQDGTLSVKGKRFLRLGKIKLFDPVKGTNITDTEYVGILDTDTGQIQCFDIGVIYEEYIKKDIQLVFTNNQKRYSITDQTKQIIVNSLFCKEQELDDKSIQDEINDIF